MRRRSLILCISFILLWGNLWMVSCDDTEDEPGEGGEPEPEVKVDDDGVTALSEEAFDSFINKHNKILIEFYAPWCGHCKQLAPEYAEASKEIDGDDSVDAKLVKVDATQAEGVASRYGVRGYPTIKFLTRKSAEDPHQTIDYDGGRTKDTIVSWVKEHADPNYEPPPSAAIDLTEANFDEVVEKTKLTLVEFYAPWCGHCKQLAPEYEKAAAKLKSDWPDIVMAKVDATAETKLGERFGVTGYPTMKLFREGGKWTEYKGPREAAGIAEYLIKQSQPPSVEFKTSEDYNRILKTQPEFDVVVIGVFAGDSDPLFLAYEEMANSLRDEYQFSHTFNSKLTKSSSSEIRVLLPEKLLTSFDEKFKSFSKKDANADEIQKWLEGSNHPLISLFNANNRKRLSLRPLCLMFFDVNFKGNKENTRYWLEKLAKVAKDYQKAPKRITFAIASDEENAQEFDDFGLMESGEDVNMACWGSNEEKYVMDEMDEWNRDDVIEFMGKVLKGKAKQYLKSQPLPKKQHSPHVEVVVAKNFEKVVMDESKDVMVFLHAPWCGHCKQFSPEYEKMAEKLSKVANLKFVKMDATMNDQLSGFTAKGYPTIFFAAAGHKRTPIRYEGNRAQDDLLKFIESNGKASSFKKDEL